MQVCAFGSVSPPAKEIFGVFINKTDLCFFASENAKNPDKIEVFRVCIFFERVDQNGRPWRMRVNPHKHSLCSIELFGSNGFIILFLCGFTRCNQHHP